MSLLRPAWLSPAPTVRPAVRRVDAPAGERARVRTRPLVWTLVNGALLVVVVGATWSLVAGDSGLWRRHDVRQRLLATQARVEVLEQENSHLRAQVHRLQSDPEAVRRAAAERLLAAPTGSTIYRFDGD
jgi:Septum formation initiator